MELVQDKDGFWKFPDTRADFTYTPLCKSLVQVGAQVKTEADRKLLLTVLKNYQ